MSYPEEELQSFLQRVENRERMARKRAVIYSLIPIVLAVLLLLFTSWQIHRANQKLTIIKEQANRSQQELVAATEKLKQAEQEVAVL